jgi:hypothetical protein
MAKAPSPFTPFDPSGWPNVGLLKGTVGGSGADQIYSNLYTIPAGASLMLTKLVMSPFADVVMSYAVLGTSGADLTLSIDENWPQASRTTDIQCGPNGAGDVRFSGGLRVTGTAGAAGEVKVILAFHMGQLPKRVDPYVANINLPAPVAPATVGVWVNANPLNGWVPGRRKDLTIAIAGDYDAQYVDATGATVVQFAKPDPATVWSQFMHSPRYRLQLRHTGQGTPAGDRAAVLTWRYF